MKITKEVELLSGQLHYDACVCVCVVFYWKNKNQDFNWDTWDFQQCINVDVCSLESTRTEVQLLHRAQEQLAFAMLASWSGHHIQTYSNNETHKNTQCCTKTPNDSSVLKYTYAYRIASHYCLIKRNLRVHNAHRLSLQNRNCLKIYHLFWSCI